MRRLPVWVTLAVLLAVWLLQWLDLTLPDGTFVRPLSQISFDWRVRLSTRYPRPCATNLAVIYIDEETLKLIASGELKLNFKGKPPLPRQVHGRLIRELGREGAKVAALDILFAELNPNDNPVPMLVREAATNGLTQAEIDAIKTHFPMEAISAEGRTNKEMGLLVESDAFFAAQMRRFSNVVLAAEMTEDLIPPPLFRTNAYAIGDIAVEKDSDGSLRHLYACRNATNWNEILQALIQAQGCKMSAGKIATNRCVFPRASGDPVEVPLDDQGRFEFKNVPGCPDELTNWPAARAFTPIRAWHMGIVIAARELGLDLDRADIDLEAGRIVLPGPPGIQRVIPVDRRGRFLINWSLTWDDPRLLHVSYGSVLQLDQRRGNPEQYNEVLKAIRDVGQHWSGPYPFADKLVVVGSRVIGSNMTDAGPTPLNRQTYFVSAHWNVANAVIQQQFVHPCPALLESLLILVLTVVSALVTWRWRVLRASACVILCGLLYLGAAAALYVTCQFCLPLELPVFGGLLANHVGLVTCRVIAEQRERRRVRSVFAKLVSPNVVNELLDSEQLAFEGARRAVTVYFADVRGFTEMTDLSQAHAEEYAREHSLAGADADKYFDEQAREVLATVNLYLSVIADMVKKHEGTLDKYIGDCVMAFWGAPTPNEKHALYCVRAAIDAQRAMAEINVKRTEENRRREKENPARQAAGLPMLPMLSVLSLGSGINSGVVTVGLMGSQDHILNYTVFGREVNLASRLEGVSGRGRIIVSESTYRELCHEDAALAATCVEQPPVMVKGFRQPVKIYEVPWKPAAPAP